MDTLPGYEEAKNLGYSLSMHSGDYSVACYTKGKLCLVAYSNSDFSLESSYRTVRLAISGLSLPNKNFEQFERQILNLLDGVEQ